jgi:hypothetical protein
MIFSGNTSESEVRAASDETKLTLASVVPTIHRVLLEHRTQGSNRKTAFRRCAESREFQSWIRLEHAKRVGAIDAAVEQALRPENLTVEYGPFDD